METGSKGENMAAEYLEKKGFEVIARNYRHKRAEIDLIVKRGNWILFVEVKTRTSFAYGEPEDFVDELKVRKIFEAAEAFIFSTNWQGHVRFDVVSVKLGAETEIMHFEDAITY
jgi:putative endonuclease